jgi:hypothetical protein
MPFTAGSWHGRGRMTACEQRGDGIVLCESNNSIGRLGAACWPPTSVRLRAATTRISRMVVTRNIPNSSVVGKCETKLVAGSWQGNGIGTAWERHGMCESDFKTAGELHGNCMGTEWYV